MIVESGGCYHDTTGDTIRKGMRLAKVGRRGGMEYYTIDFANGRNGFRLNYKRESLRDTAFRQLEMAIENGDRLVRLDEDID